MKIKVLFALALTLVMLAACGQTTTTKIDNQPTDKVEDVTTEDGQKTDESDTQTTETPEQPTVTEDTQKTDEPATVDVEIKHEPNPDDPGVDRGVWEYVTRTAENGDIVYDFGDFFVTIPASWDGKYRTEMNELGDSMSMTFYQTLSEDLFVDKYGFGGGKLFSVSYSANDDYLQLPSYYVIGTSEDSRTYFLAYPTDVQAFTEDEAAAAEYLEMFGQLKYIEENSHMADAVG